MAPDDEVLFGRVSDESRASFERVEHLVDQARRDGSSSELAVALAQFELHGATFRSLLHWYPDEDRVRTALTDWEFFSNQLTSRGLPIEA